MKIESAHVHADRPQLKREITVACATKAQQVLLYTETANFPCHTVTGSLLCTNYRCCFVPDPASAEKVSSVENGSLAFSKSVPLGCISGVNTLSGGRRKALDGRTSLPKRILEFEIVCKDLRRLVFNLKNCPKSEVTTVVNAIGRHTHPSSVHNLFTFDYTRTLKSVKGTSNGHADSLAPSFLSPRDWEKELHRLGVTSDQWRVTEANKRFLICDSLCPYFVCPANISDSMLEYAASLHLHSRLPVWCWSHPHTGVSLTRGALPEVDDQSEAPDPNYLYAISMARHIDHQVEGKRIQQYDITKLCGTVKDIHTGFSRMQEMSLPMSLSDLSSLDRHWLQGLEYSGWMALACSCLVLAKEVAHTLCVKKKCAMLLEDDGRDLSCVISSLVQLMTDSHFRSIPGFEALIQKEWVAMGHPFMTRHGFIVDSLTYGSEEQLQEAPVFLLFLDCVWQLSHQFPSAFEFSESYLLCLYEVVHSCLYGTFVFDSAKRRLQASLHSKRSSFFGNGDESMELADDYNGPLLSAWGRWRESFSKDENEECLNPLYYIFGSGDAHYNYSTADPLPLDSDHFNSVVKDTAPNLTVGGSYGLYRGSSSLQSKDDQNSTDYYQMGLLVPETSLCNIKLWEGFFLRYLPQTKAQRHYRLVVQRLESRLVRDVRKFKDELNELELSVGSFTSDLTSFIGNVLEAREEEILRERKVSVDANVPFRPRLSAVLVPYGDKEEEHGNDHEQDGEFLRQASHRSLPCQRQLSSLAQFTDALYSSELEASKGMRPRQLTERSTSSPGMPRIPSPGGKSPVTKTRLRVTREDSKDPARQALRWQSAPDMHNRHVPLVTGKILSRKDSGVIEESSNELTEL